MPASLRLVPTRTLGRRLRHDLARQGQLVRPSAIQTLAGFLDRHAREPREPSPAQLRLLVRRELARFNSPRWSAPGLQPGLEAALVRLTGEMDAAGYTARELEQTADLLRRDYPDAQEFLRFHAQLERAVAGQGWALRNQRLRVATGRIFRGGMQDVNQVAFEGFFSFTEAEIALIDAIRRHAEISITLPDWPGAARSRSLIRARGFDDRILTTATTVPRRFELVEPPSLEAEVQEIARRVLELHRAGRPLNDIAVVVRSGQPYVPALRTAFERFGIPANYYFPRTLRETAEFRKADAWMTADPLRWVRQLDPAREYDALEFELRQRLPGLTMDQALASAATQAELLEPLEPFLREFRSVWGEADPIEECWPHFREYAGEAVVREAADLAGAVRVIDAQEARQWRIPVVFAPGLIEGEFPRTPREEPLFPDSLRRSLNAYGLMLRTMDDRMAEERFLCEHTLARGSDLVVASYPRFDRQGEPLQRAFCLEDREARLAADSVWPRPARSRAPAPAAGFVPPAAAAARHTAWRPSSIESFLQCPFQFYGRYTLRLAPAPERPDQRFSALARGSVIHNVLARYQERKGAVPFETLLDPLLEEARAEYGIPPGYEFELRRLEMLRHLRDFAREFAPASGGEARFEQPVRFTLAPGVELRGRIDRFDLYPNGAVAAYDFKYSKAPGFGKKIREQAPLVQGGLYLIALEQQGYRPRSFHYVALRDACQLVGWSDPPAVRELIERARYLTLESVERIRAGEIRVAPRDVQNCAWCELWDACRVDQQPAAAPEEVQVAHA